jgi:hypothetical protein
MRSDLVFWGACQISNRYQLFKLASKGTRSLHRPNTRLEDTTNDALVCLRRTSPIADTQVALESAAFQGRAA